MNVNIYEIAAGICGTVGPPLAMAAIREMPENLPKSLNGWWQYLRATLQQYLSMKGVGNDPPTNP